MQIRNLVVLVLGICFIVIGLYFNTRAYTALTFVSTGLLFITITFLWKATWIDRVLTTYAVLLIPFFIVNGILTGTGLDEPVVWYNDEENLGIRLLTIPIEDIVYGFELFLLTVFFYEKLNPYLQAIRQPGTPKRNMD